MFVKILKSSYFFSNLFDKLFIAILLWEYYYISCDHNKYRRWVVCYGHTKIHVIKVGFNMIQSYRATDVTHLCTFGLC